MGSAIIVYAALRRASRKESEEVKSEIKEIRKDIQSLDSRVARIEGFLFGVSHWEPKIKQREK